jgi:hypothetical protein
MGAVNDLYETDVVLWSEQQADLLRRRAAGELVNDAELDWPNIAEEIEAVGGEQRHAVESLLMRALVHMLKAEAWPLSRQAPHYRDAAKALPETIDGRPPLPVAADCPATLEELLADD